MKKKIWYLCILIVVLYLGSQIGQTLIKKGVIGDMPGGIASFLDGVTGLFSTEPTEVKKLRNEELPVQDADHIEFYYYQLDENEQRAYRQIIEGVKERKTDFYVTLSEADSLDKTYHAVMKDHPELFWIQNKKEVFRTTYGDSTYCTFSPGYEYDSQESAAIEKAMDDAYWDIKWSIADDYSEYDIVRAVYTYVIDHADYAFSDHDQSVAGIFYYKNAVCAGYARAMQYLLERLGIYCLYVDGDVLGRTDGHAWNIVRIDGEFYYVDATNADQPEFLKGDAAALAEHKTTIMDYLCPFPEEYEITYTPSDEFIVPPCTAKDKNFYVLNNGIFDNYDRQTIYDYCCMRMDNNAAVVRFKFSSQEAFEAACDEWIRGNALSDAAQYYMRIHGLHTVEYHYGMLEELKTIYFIF